MTRQVRDVIIDKAFALKLLIHQNFSTWEKRYAARLIVIQILVGKEAPLVDIQDAFNQLGVERRR